MGKILVVIRMKLRSMSFSSIFLLFLLSYVFYTCYLLGQINLNINGKNIIWIYVILTLLIPFCYLYLNKKFETIRNISLKEFINKKHSKSFNIVKIFLSLYLLISGIFVSFYTIYFESMYFYNKYNVYIIAIILSIPIMVFSNKIIKSTFHLQPLTLILYIMFFYVFLTNQHELKYYTLLSNNFEIDNVILTILLFVPLLLEPFIILYLCDLSNEKITKKKMILGVILIAFTTSISFLQIGNQFGELLLKLEFPFLQAWKNIYVNEYVENLDCFNIIVFIFNCLSRLLLSIAIIQKITDISGRFIPVMFGILTLGIGCLLTTNQTLFQELKYPLLMINSMLLIIVSAITIFYIKKLGDYTYDKK